MSYKDQTGKTVDLVGLEWYKEFRSAIEDICESAKSATTQKQMLDVLDRLECEMNIAPVDKLVFDIAWRIQYFKRSGLEFYRMNVKYPTHMKWGMSIPTVKEAYGRSPLYGVIYDLDYFLGDLRRVISESTPISCFEFAAK